MLEHYLRLGGVEIANHARLNAYLTSVGSPLDSTTVCGCDSFDADLVGDEPYTNPADDYAPWYDPDIPESADFAGLMVLTVEGLDDHPQERTATPAVTGGAAFTGARVLPRTITVTGVLLGATCCGVEYGLHWLAQALSGCGDGGCDGDCLEFFNCCPPEDTDPDEFAARHRRTLRRVALISGPTVTARHGTGCTSGGACQTGADVITVEVVLTAGTPWLWRDPVALLDVEVPADDGACIEWCVHDPKAPPRPDPVCMELADAPACPDGVLIPVTDTPPAGCAVEWLDEEHAVRKCAGGCRLAKCPDPAELCTSPGCRTPDPPAPAPPETCFCHALAVNSAAYELDLTSWPRWFGAVPMIAAHAGSGELRHVTVSLYERRAVHAGLSCEEVAAMERCNPHSVFEIGYVPLGGVVTLDGQVGRATVSCMGQCGPSPDAYGRDGGPLRFPLLTCDRYCVLVHADAMHPPAEDARITLALSGRGY